MQFTGAATVWCRHIANVSFLLYPYPFPTLEFPGLKILTSEPQRAGMALYSPCCLNPCLPNSYQELKCLEMKAVPAERMREQEEGENV